MANEQKKIGWLTNSKAMDKECNTNERSHFQMVDERIQKEASKAGKIFLSSYFHIFIHTQFFFDVLYARTR